MSFKLQEGEVYNIEFKGHKFLYKVERYEIFKDYWALIVVGGPYKIRATTTCRKRHLKPRLKRLILALMHK